MRRFLWIGVLALAITAGCSSDEGTQRNETSAEIQQKQEAEFQRIQNNQNLPPQARAAAVMMAKQKQEQARMAAQLPRK